MKLPSLKFLFIIFLLMFAYQVFFKQERYPDSTLPVEEVNPDDYADYNWQQKRAMTTREMKDYIRIDSQTMYHKDSVPPGVEVPKWIKPPKPDQRKFKEQYNLTEDDVREILNQEMD